MKRRNAWGEFLRGPTPPFQFSLRRKFTLPLFSPRAISVPPRHLPAARDPISHTRPSEKRRSKWHLIDIDVMPFRLEETSIHGRFDIDLVNHFLLGCARAPARTRDASWRATRSTEKYLVKLSSLDLCERCPFPDASFLHVSTIAVARFYAEYNSTPCAAYYTM